MDSIAAHAMIAARSRRGWHLQSYGKAVGRWLGVFAIAMLFIGPPIGQWRAAQQASDAGIAPVAMHADAGHTNASHADGAHAHHHSHAHDGEGASNKSHGTRSQVGVLVLDHCGYCHLVACFAALPGTGLALPVLDWSRLPLAQAAYQAPSAPFVSYRRARAPPVFHA